MSFLGILLSIFLIGYFVSLILRPLLPRLLMWLVQRNINKQMENAFGQQQSQQQRRQRRWSWPFGGGGGGDKQPKRQRRRGKIFSREVGEYVEFEEIQASWPEPDPSAGNFKPECQVSDADWEDL